jgi:hypothetical protein
MITLSKLPFPLNEASFKKQDLLNLTDIIICDPVHSNNSEVFTAKNLSWIRGATCKYPRQTKSSSTNHSIKIDFLIKSELIYIKMKTIVNYQVLVAMLNSSMTFVFPETSEVPKAKILPLTLTRPAPNRLNLELPTSVQVSLTAL